MISGFTFPFAFPFATMVEVIANSKFCLMALKFPPSNNCTCAIPTNNQGSLPNDCKACW